MEHGAYHYRFGNVEFDEARFGLKVAGETVEIEPKALALLAYLLRHAGEVVTKDELLRELWAGRVTVEKVLPNAVNKLRRALGEANAAHIATQARIGYRFDGPLSRTAVGRQPLSTVQLLASHPVPGRENFLLQRALGARAGSEVWLAEHAKTRELRVYKFALDGEHLRHLKREATLLRVLQESLPERTCFVGLIDWNFERVPFYLECEFGGSSLLHWAETGLPLLQTAQRLELFLQIADAVAAAHSVGVLHKDLKPANVLIEGEAAAPRVRLTDFGSGRLLDPQRLEQLGITRLGMTVQDAAGADPSSGTPLYIAPELFAGQAPTVRSDLFALGVLLYQMLSGRMNQPMVSGWEAEISDPILREDLRRATQIDPSQRPASVAEFAADLRALASRHQQARLAHTLELRSREATELLQRSRARRPYLIALLLALGLGLIASLLLQQQAQQQRRAAEAALARASAVTRFINEDLISRANPLVLARGAEAPLKEVLLTARERISTRLAGQPLAEASIRISLATSFGALDLWAEGEADAARALALFEQAGDDAADDVLRARALRVHLLSRLSRFEQAEAEIALLSSAEQQRGDALSRHALAKARSSFLMTRGGFAEVVPELRLALQTLSDIEPDNEPLRDSLRIDLVVALGLSSKYAEAEQEANALIDEARARSGDSRLVIALAELAVARSHSSLGDHARAEALLLSAQAVIVEQLGEGHSRNLGLINELMAVAFRQNDWAKALPYAEQVATRVAERFGAEHNMSLVSLGNWGRILYETGAFEDAAVHLRRARAGLVRELGADAPQTQDLSLVLAGVELELGHSEAGASLIELLQAEALENGRGTGHWPAAIKALQGLLALQRGDSSRALELLEPAVAELSEEPAAENSRLYRSARAALHTLRGKRL